MDVKLSDLKAMMTALGFQGVEEWSVGKTCQKLFKASQIAAEEIGNLPAPFVNLLDDFELMQELGGLVCVLDADGLLAAEIKLEAVVKNLAKQPLPAPIPPKAKHRPVGNSAAPPGQPGIIETIRTVLRAATEARPATKADILDALCLAFPHRDRKSMRTTIDIQIPTRLTKNGYPVRKGVYGYWLDPDEGGR